MMAFIARRPIVLHDFDDELATVPGRAICGSRSNASGARSGSMDQAKRRKVAGRDPMPDRTPRTAVGADPGRELVDCMAAALIARTRRTRLADPKRIARAFRRAGGGTAALPGCQTTRRGLPRSSGWRPRWGLSGLGLAVSDRNVDVEHSPRASAMKTDPRLGANHPVT